MGRILIRHADIITLNAGGRILRDAEIAIENGLIAALGTAPADFEPDETVDATDHIVMPGFHNAHTHSPMTLVRGWAEDMPLERWLNDRIWRAESALTADDVYWGAALAAAEMIRGGTVGFADHYFYMDRVAQVVTESGLRANLAWGVFGAESGEVGATLPGIADFVAGWQGAADGRIRTMLGPHSPYTCSPQFLARTAAAAARLGVGIHIHLAESMEQVEHSLAHYDLTPVEMLDRNGVLDVPVLAAHAIYLTEADRTILASRQVTVVQCPTCHMKLGMGVTPVPALQAAGVNVALGTDGPASNNALDMLQEARHAALLQKLHGLDPELMAGDLVLRMATQNGARALGFPLSGELSPGHYADLIMIDCATPRMRPRHDLVANVLYAAGSADVSDVMVAGRWLMRRRVLLTLDEARILDEAERRALRMVGGALHRLRSY
ncbi:MAG: N-ethylammeline chlorohydrolase [Chloroflexi bacterium HGW-Chloroflexi-1]|nr:MAG: N-ethylammeline chlorohydrolase [Chloroflexi bacterium HGW-Chloroflexi-1]